ncbi:hypothetical protein GOZ89_10820 [Agrobacterium vitis]|uniref:hypothetical protein n=1 Tax=Agrobacterium vitis TaxID=373 RepID=UPI0012E8A2C6|nr:hypothetical protein [Agrobacterium vitis]MVA79907.1 hypothetical protein [Agrobacterium vitis]
MDINGPRADVLELLLLEITEALVNRQTLRREDVAGALLRTEWGAEVIDDVGEEDGEVIRPRAGMAELLTKYWTKRLSLQPDIYTLRLHHMKWLSSGQKGPPPLDPKNIVQLYAEDDDD